MKMSLKRLCLYLVLITLIGCLKGLKSIRLLSALVSELDFIFSSFLIHIEPLLRFQIYPASLFFVTPIYTFLFLYLYLYQKICEESTNFTFKGSTTTFFVPTVAFVVTALVFPRFIQLYDNQLPRNTQETPEGVLSEIWQ